MAKDTQKAQNDAQNDANPQNGAENTENEFQEPLKPIEKAKSPKMQVIQHADNTIDLQIGGKVYKDISLKSRNVEAAEVNHDFYLIDWMLTGEALKARTQYYNRLAWASLLLHDPNLDYEEFRDSLEMEDLLRIRTTMELVLARDNPSMLDLRVAAAKAAQAEAEKKTNTSEKADASVASAG